uniref:Putative secreted protein n=1 Tax=Ixodes ricinus TaxID=34613 RepID=A0A6B0UR30_IXORI
MSIKVYPFLKKVLLISWQKVLSVTFTLRRNSVVCISGSFTNKEKKALAFERQSSFKDNFRIPFHTEKIKGLKGLRNNLRLKKYIVIIWPNGETCLEDVLSKTILLKTAEATVMLRLPRDIDTICVLR